MEGTPTPDQITPSPTTPFPDLGTSSQTTSSEQMMLPTQAASPDIALHKTTLLHQQQLLRDLEATPPPKQDVLRGTYDLEKPSELDAPVCQEDDLLNQSLPSSSDTPRSSETSSSLNNELDFTNPTVGKDMLIDLSFLEEKARNQAINNSENGIQYRANINGNDLKHAIKSEGKTVDKPEESSSNIPVASPKKIIPPANSLSKTKTPKKASTSRLQKPTISQQQKLKTSTNTDKKSPSSSPASTRRKPMQNQKVNSIQRRTESSSREREPRKGTNKGLENIQNDSRNRRLSPRTTEGRGLSPRTTDTRGMSPRTTRRQTTSSTRPSRKGSPTTQLYDSPLI